jgi:phospholipid transport system transporter-binding protein
MQLPATSTLAQAPALLLQLDAALAATDGGATLTVDAAALQDFDSSAIALLLHGRRQAAATGRRFAVSGAPPKLRELARLYGVAELLSLDEG